MTEIKLINSDEDLDTCAALMSSSEPFSTLGFDLQWCRMAMRGPVKEVYAAYIDNTYAGFVVLQFAGVLRGYIQTICVEPLYRSRGIGTELLEFSEKHFLQQFPNVFICVSSFNHAAQKLYYRLGYEKIGELKDHIVKGYDEYILRKQLCPITEFKR